MPSGDHQTYFWRGVKGQNHPKWKGGREALTARRRRIYDELKRRPCMDCQGWFEPCQMDFDHIRDKQFQISYEKHASLKRLMTEVRKCEVVCANCHRLRTEQRRQQQISKVS